jgi:hypothetical protein
MSGVIRLAVTRLVFAGLVGVGCCTESFAQVVVATGGVLRVLDRLTGQVSDYDLAPGQKQVEGRLTLRLDECRYPADSPLSDAFAHVTVLDSGLTDPVFQGWMVASSPALSALDHPRYDVWVLRCDVPMSAMPPSPDSTKPAAGSGG